MQDPRKTTGLSFALRLIATLFLLAAVNNASVTIKSAERIQDPEEVIRVRTDLVAVPLIVVDSRGRRVSGLKAEDFVLTDDERKAKIDYFASGTERVALLFALDVSGSARDILAQQREAARALFSKFGPGSRIAVLHFGDFVRLTVPFTGNANSAEQSFNLPAQKTKGTAIFDGAAAAARSFDASGGFSTERRIVLLMSDGLDTLSSTRYSAVIEAARARGVSFYVIHFPLFTPREGRLEPRPPSKGFRELAEQTGGRYFRIGDAKSALDPSAHYDLTSVFQAIDDDLRGQYVLGFYPGDASRDGQTHSVIVTVANRSRKLKVNQLKASYRLK